MIVQSLIDLFFQLIITFLGGFELIGLPFNLIGTLSTIIVYGTWVVGADLLAIAASTVVGWWLFKLTIGIFIFIWELLPLT